jgi:Ca2+-binding RTX toxin-like protein
MAKSTLRYFKQSGDVNELSDLIGDVASNGTFGTPSRHKVVLTGTDGGKIVFKGDFQVVNGAITSGTVTGFTAILDGKRVMRAIDYDVSFPDLANALEDAQGTNGDSEAFNFMLLTAKQVIGSKGDDTMAGVAKLLIGGEGDDTIISSFGDKTVKGEAGNDTIIAGSGNDSLYGGKGRDIFAFTDVTDGVDRIRDFSSKKDKFGFDDGSFKALGGTIEATEFFVGEDALTADQHIIYDGQSGKLYWDEDGVGGVDKILLARLTDSPKLTVANMAIDDYT